ncbi:L-aspartate oxidase [Actinocorallia sp. API 0066]|uniref:L-aspartate oxidase n=1 Tax=Actinocorallia sp. API 0066 TaxID=2896846 RepID=UPI001E3F465F|nr:L-aspartate oxidase [Actinocorallia sp. API 0066]MCD0452279.1 L-aspartate oxidase [Actinocorallia sp. API 0066]
MIERLTAGAPGWHVDTDVVVIGSGIAGLVAAIRAAAHGRVLLVTKALLDAGSTRWAQGGIAAALAPEDSPAEHLADTLTAGVGLCDEDAVAALVTEGPGAVRRLIEAGAHFDLAPDGSVSLTREGGHHRRRIAHAGGDATGAEISRALLAVLKETDGVEVIEHALVLDLLMDGGRAAGVTLHVMGEGSHDGVGAVRARAVILATGGLGQVFAATTNPEVSTGDGVALALRAGAEVADLEFVQFHPTVMWLGPDAEGQQPLISEAVRGEGAHLVDASGERFMAGRHELAELAPRDVVAKGIMSRMRETGEPCMWLDGRHLGAAFWESRFPNILASCRLHGVDPVTEPVPVVPAAHYASGGVRTDLRGRTTIPGLYACGEVACTGVHGANRLASNSLLEGLVFAERIGEAIRDDLAGPRPQARPSERATGLLDPSVRAEVQHVMSAYCGVLRGAEGLAKAERRLAELATRTSARPGVAAWEATNLHQVATAVVAAARTRAETRGSHWREDFPGRDDAAWLGRLAGRLGPDGYTLRTLPARAAETTTTPVKGE